MPFVSALVALVALALSGAALANHLDPRERITPADQARARAMLLKSTDLGPGVRAQPNGPDPHVDCRGVDQSALTITGDAESPTFISGVWVFGSSAVVYRSKAESNAGWRLSTNAAAGRCLRTILGREYGKQGLTLRSFRTVAFPRVAQRRVAYRAVLAGEAQGVTIPLTLDVVALLHGRAQVALLFGSLAPVPRAEEVRLARLVAKRMATAMRGG